MGRCLFQQTHVYITVGLVALCSVVPGTFDLTSCQACKGKARTAAVGGKQRRTQDAGCWHTACVLLCLLPKCAAAPALG